MKIETSMSRNKKWLSMLLILLLFFLSVPVQVEANDENVLQSLPYTTPVDHSYSYDDIANTAAVVVFGTLDDNSSTSYYLSMIDSLVDTNMLDLTILFYDLQNDEKKISRFIESHSWNHINAFAGGREEMWTVLESNGINTTVYLPVVFYISENGQLSSIYDGNLDQEFLISEVKKLVGRGDKDTAPLTSFKVLADEGDTDFEGRKREIDKQLERIDPKLNVTYEKASNYTAPHFAGSLQPSYQQNALKTINLVRYLSGLPEVTLDKKYISYAQHAAVLMKASAYGHYPEKPSNMSQNFYELGYKGTSEGNIYWGYKNLFDGIVHGWMADEDISNIDRLGHRRWALNPKMGATGFGEYDTLGAMYAIDQSVVGFKYEAIAYPSGAAFPSEFFKGDYPWHVSVNPSLFETPSKDKVSVTLSGGGKTITFSKKDNSFKGNYFNIDTEGYGINNSIVFRPIDINHYVGTYTVQIYGLKTIMGEEVVLSYSTTFYDDSYVHIPTPPVQKVDRKEQPSIWAVEDVADAIESGLVPKDLMSNYTAPITRAEFSHLAVLLYESMREEIEPISSFNDTTDINIRKIATLGIVNGIGNGIFNPNGQLTREQAAKILDLLIATIGYEAASDDMISYSDSTSISAWAMPHIESVSRMEIMSGIGENNFDPQGQFTREQSIVTMLTIRGLE